MPTSYLPDFPTSRFRRVLSVFYYLLLAVCTLWLPFAASAQAKRHTPKRAPIRQGAANYNVGIANHTGYAKGVGLRAGSPTVASIRAFKGNTALEGLLGGRVGTRGFYLGALLEQHFDIPGVPGLRAFIGFGGHVFSYKGKYFYYYHYNREGRLQFLDQYEKRFKGLVPDAIVGVEYQFMGKPWTLGADFKPCYERVYGTRYFLPDVGVTGRYIF